MPALNILAISGSLKATSSNTVILKTLSEFFPDRMRVTLYEGLEQLPHFNPDKEAGNADISDLKALLKQADGVIISTPEYAFGVPGVLKNALEWTVSSGELNEKPVAAISASPLYGGGDKAMASLLLTLGALGTTMNEHSSLSIPDILNKIKDGRVTDPKTLQTLRDLCENLILVIEKLK